MFSFLFRYSFQKRMDNFNYNCHKWKGVKTQRIERKKNYEKKKSQKKNDKTTRYSIANSWY